MTFVSSVHNPKIMLGMLVKILRGDSIATRIRFPREGNVTFEDLMSGAPNFDARAITIEGLTSARYLLPIAVGIVTVIATIRSAGLSWSHDTCSVDGEIGSFSNESVSERFRSGDGRCCAAFLLSAKLFRAGTLDGLVLVSNIFCAMLRRSRPHWRRFPV